MVSSTAEVISAAWLKRELNRSTHECSQLREHKLPTELHRKLVLKSRSFLRKKGCKNIVCKMLQISGEVPDAIGWKPSGHSVLVEAKASRADFLSDRKKKVRKNPATGTGDYRYYICEPGVIIPSDLPPRWGLIYLREASAEIIVEAALQEANKHQEVRMLSYLLNKVVA